MKRWDLHLAALLLTFFVTPPAPAESLRIVVTTELAGSLVKTVGSDHVTVESIVRGDQDPRYVNPRPSLCVPLNKADLLVSIGQGLESLWLPELLAQCRNTRVEEGSDGYLDLSKGVKILPLPSSSEEVPYGWFSQLMGRLFVGPHQPGSVPGTPAWGNPSYWLDPSNGEVMANGILTKLASKDPLNASQYRKNKEEFTARLQERMQFWDARMEPLRNMPIATYGMGWMYLAHRHGLKIVGTLETQEGRRVVTQQKAVLIETMKAQGAKTLWMEPYQDHKMAAKIAHEADAAVQILPSSVEQSQGIGDYIEMFDVIYDRILDQF